MALVTTPGSSSADSYQTLAGANTFFGTLQVAESWTKRTEPQREVALKNAAQEIDRYIREHISNVVVHNQALAWPFWYHDFQGEFAFSIAADSGSLTTIVSDNLENSTWHDDYFNTGAAFVKEANEEAPEFELRAVVDFVRQTGTVTTEEFTVAIEASDTIYLIRPAPRWLKEAQCHQALFLLTDNRTATDADMQAGISSRSNDLGGTTSYAMDSPATWLCKEAFKLLFPNIPMAVELGRG